MLFRPGNFQGFYATEIYLPLTVMSDAVRDASRKLRGKEDTQKHKTSLPVVSWKTLVRRKPALLLESQKADGNVRLSELGVLCQFARHVTMGASIFEIGTFDGRTTLNLALNAPGCPIATLDLPRQSQTRLETSPFERHYIDKDASGQRFLDNKDRYPEAVGRITQLYGDSASFDFSPYEGRCDLVFVDGSHAYDYVMKDSETAFRLIGDRGVVLWHDYGVWPDVTRALEDLFRNHRLTLYHIHATSLVACRIGDLA